MIAACPGCATAPAGLELAHKGVAAARNTVQLSVPSMRCAACISGIETHLSRLEGVQSARVNLTLKRVTVETDLPSDALTHHLAKIGYEAFPLDPAALGAETDATGRDLLLRMGVAGFAMMNVMLLSVAVWSGATGATRDLFHLISAAIALPAALYAAQPFFLHAASAFRVGRLNMDVPISLAIILAGGMSLYEALNGGAHAYFDAALSLTFFLLIGRYLEHRTRAAARSAAKELSALEVRRVQRKTGAGYETLDADALVIGDVVLVPTGGRVPVDGTLLGDAATTDRSFLTGESAPIQHAQSAALNAGEINLGAPFEMRADAIGQDTRLRRIAELVETAENARNSYTSLADRAARLYAPAVHLLAAASFVGWYALDGDLRQALNIAIAVLIITCPCALGLAVPAVSTAAMSRLYRMGFLVKSGTALERLAEVDQVIFDKTGTLTTPGFVFNPEALDPTQRAVARALAQATGHPLSGALDAYLDGVTPAVLENVVEVAGSGVLGRFEGQDVALGRAAWLGLAGSGLGLKIGKAARLLPYDERLIAGGEGIASGLDQRGLDLEILSGDAKERTARLADAMGIASHSAGMSPEAKLRHVADLAAEDKRVCMVGDGLNDTGALARAHASVAPGAALDAARNSADVILLGQSLRDLPRLFDVAKQAGRLSRQNFAIALAYNAIAVPVAILGYATPLIAALAMSASSLTVLANAMRIGGPR